MTVWCLEALYLEALYLEALYLEVLYLEVLAGIALSLAILMALAWMVQQRTGNSGWVDTTWTFSVGLTGAR